jgi:hypothetical protein
MKPAILLKYDEKGQVKSGRLADLESNKCIPGICFDAIVDLATKAKHGLENEWSKARLRERMYRRKLEWERQMAAECCGG